MLDCEGAAETTAGVGRRPFHEFQILDRGKQAARFRANAEVPKGMAGVVPSHPARETGAQVLQPESVHQEGGKLVSLGGGLPGLLLLPASLGKKAGHVANHGGA